MGRLVNAFEAMLLALIFSAAYWFVGFVAAKIFNVEIRTKIGYILSAIGGALCHRMFIIYLQ